MNVRDKFEAAAGIIYHHSQHAPKRERTKRSQAAEEGIINFHLLAYDALHPEAKKSLLEVAPTTLATLFLSMSVDYDLKLILVKPKKSSFIVRLRARLLCCPMLFHIERVDQVRHLGVFFIFSLKLTLHVDTVLSVINQRLCLLSQLKVQGLPSDSLQIIFHASILSKVEYAFPAIAGLLSESDESKLDVFFRKAKRRGLCHCDAKCKLFKQIQLSHHCLNSLPPSSRLPYSSYSLRSRGHQFSLPQLNTVLYKNMFVNRCLFQ